MTFEEEDQPSSQPPTPIPLPALPVPALEPAPVAGTARSSPSLSLPPSPFPASSSVVSLAQRVARIRSEVDALALVSSWELDGVGALALFDGVLELSDRMQAIAVRALPVVEAGVPWPISPTTGGCHLSGFLTTAHSQGLLIALRAVHAADDDRTASKRRAGALSDLARLTLDHDQAGKGASVRPHISVLIDYPTLMTLATTAGTAHQIKPAVLNPAVLNPAVLEDGQGGDTSKNSQSVAALYPRSSASGSAAAAHRLASVRSRSTGDQGCLLQQEPFPGVLGVDQCCAAYRAGRCGGGEDLGLLHGDPPLPTGRTRTAMACIRSDSSNTPSNSANAPAPSSSRGDTSANASTCARIAATCCANDTTDEGEDGDGGSDDDAQFSFSNAISRLLPSSLSPFPMQSTPDRGSDIFHPLSGMRCGQRKAPRNLWITICQGRLRVGQFRQKGHHSPRAMPPARARSRHDPCYSNQSDAVLAWPARVSTSRHACPDC